MLVSGVDVKEVGDQTIKFVSNFFKQIAYIIYVINIDFANEVSEPKLDRFTAFRFYLFGCFGFWCFSV